MITQRRESRHLSMSCYSQTPWIKQNGDLLEQ